MEAAFESVAARLLLLIEQRAAVLVGNISFLDGMLEQDRAVQLAAVEGFIELIVTNPKVRAFILSRLSLRSRPVKAAKRTFDSVRVCVASDTNNPTPRDVIN